MTFETVSVFVISLILLWVKPGPGQAFKITSTLNGGFAAGFSVVLGVITACVIFFLVAVFGLHLVTQFFAQASVFFKLIGAVYLLYLGYSGLQNIQKGRWEGLSKTSGGQKYIESYFSALVLTLANPLPIFYFLGIMPTLVPVGSFASSDIMTGAGIIIAVGLGVDTLLILLVSEVKKALSDIKVIKKINLLTSIGFILLGLFFLYSAFFLSDFSYRLV